MVDYIRSDLDFILAQIKIAEAHAAGQPLFGDGGLVPTYNSSLGLRTVDGTFNNLLPGQEQWGAANNPFPENLPLDFRPASDVLDLNGPAPGGLTAGDYSPSNNPGNIVVDSTLRTISNLIVDQSLGNPAAVFKALQTGGVAPADLATVQAVLDIHNAFQPFLIDAYRSGVAADNALADMNEAQAAYDLDPTPANQALLDAAIAANGVAAAAAAVDAAELIDARAVRDAAIEPFGIAMDGDNVQVLNVAPDGGLSAPFNSMFTLFGQFFDHGLDLVDKGGSGVVYIPLQPDDPLYVPGSNTNFMVLTRATVLPGQDGVMGTEDDIRPINRTTSFVDQNQTYTSHASHQVFLRQYELNDQGRPVATGKLIEGGGAQPGGMATWGEVKAQALLLGIELTDYDVGNVPLLRTDQYGNFIPDANGFAQVIIGIGVDGIPNTADDVVVSQGASGVPINPTDVLAIRTGHTFLADIAHDAVPVGKVADGDITIGLGNPGNGSTEYDNELLDAHFIAGDGRVNENIGLTAVHSIFHSEHNRLVEHTKDVVLADAAALLASGASQAEAVAFLNEWLATDVTEVPDTPAEISGLAWDGNRIFQAAKFGTEMQYQHLVFEDFARKIQPNIDFFIVPDGYHADINPSIVAEFAHVVYRFGHSMLNEQIDRLDSSFNNDQIGLIEAFLNPVAFDAGHTIADNIAAGDIIRGMTRQVGNEIDEFVTSALQNNLLGLPLDLATINLARGRDTGVPSLNNVRREFYEASQQAPELKPYESWTDYAANLKNEASIINFVAAYGTHSAITGESTIAGKRAVAMAMIFNQDMTFTNELGQQETIVAASITDAADFLNSAGDWANDIDGNVITGLDLVDLWIGGLAEKILPFGGMLGSTFNYVFEIQMEMLQDGDRFYYLQRLDGLHLLAEMENNTFAKLIAANADVGHLPSDVFSTPGLILEVDRTRQYNPGLGETAGADGIMEDDPLTVGVDESADNLGNDPVGGTILTPLVIRNNPATIGPDTNYLRYTGADHVLLGGTDNNDILIASEGDDTLHGDAGNDRMEGGAGNDSYIGGAGDDIITDLGGDDIIRSGAGNDAVNAGVGTDLIIADDGNDFVVLGADLLDETFLGTGNDYVLGSKTTEMSLGGEGDDWIEIGAWTGAVGDNFDDVLAADAVTGHDVFRGDGGFDEFIGEGGDDIWIGTVGRGKFDGMSGYDWATYKDYKFGVDADLTRLDLPSQPLPPANAALDTFTFVEGVSGSVFNDMISGTDFTSAEIMLQGARGSVLTAEGIALIDGLQAVLGAGVTSFTGGNILLGGDGNDRFLGRGGDDIIDGDRWLNVRVGVFENIGVDGGEGQEIASADSLKDLVTQVFNGTYNPGQFRIVREILTANGTGDIDTAVFSDVLANYTITYNPDGSVTVSHTGGTGADGTDTLRNIEVLDFTDVDVGPPVAVIDANASTNAVTENAANGTLAGITASSVGAVSYALTSNPGGLFAINATTGVVTVAAGIDREALGATATIGVTATYLLGATSTQTFVVNINDADEFDASVPVDTNVAANSVAEDAVIGTVVGITALSSDADATNNVVTYSLSNSAGGRFAIDSITGVVTVAAGLDFEAGAAQQIEVTANSTDGSSSAQTFTVNLTNVNEGPVAVADAGAAQGENVVNAVFDVLANDIDPDNVRAELTTAVVSAAVTSGNAAINGLANASSLFSVNGNGDIVFNPGTALDALNDGDTASFSVTYSVTDPGGLTSQAALTFTVNGGDEIITGDGNANVLAGTAFNDRQQGLGDNDTLLGSAGADEMEGGTGFDTVDYSAQGSGIQVALDGTLAGTGLAAGDTFVSIEHVIGTNFVDYLVGNAFGTTITGLNGSDSIYGRGGSDTLNGGDGDDRLIGGVGGDSIVGGNGNDTAMYHMATSAVNVALDGSIAALGEAVGDTFNSVESLTGSQFGDILVGNAVSNFLAGGDGVDRLEGKLGADNLSGNAGADILLGGLGNDTFRYHLLSDGGDTINDYSNVGGNNDRFVFTNSAFGNVGVGALQASEFQVGTSNLALSATVRFFYETDTGILRFDSNGNGAGGTTVIATLAPATALTIADIASEVDHRHKPCLPCSCRAGTFLGSPSSLAT
jgi:Ca2+-binding RTX toxin-like protein